MLNEMSVTKKIIKCFYLYLVTIMVKTIEIDNMIMIAREQKLREKMWTCSVGINP